MNIPKSDFFLFYGVNSIIIPFGQNEGCIGIWQTAPNSADWFLDIWSWNVWFLLVVLSMKESKTTKSPGA